MASRPGGSKEGGLPLACPSFCSLAGFLSGASPPLLHRPLGREDTERLISCYNNTYHLSLRLTRLFSPCRVTDLPVQCPVPLELASTGPAFGLRVVSEGITTIAINSEWWCSWFPIMERSLCAVVMMKPVQALSHLISQ